MCFEERGLTQWDDMSIRRLVCLCLHLRSRVYADTKYRQTPQKVFCSALLSVSGREVISRIHFACYLEIWRVNGAYLQWNLKGFPRLSTISAVLWLGMFTWSRTYSKILLRGEVTSRLSPSMKSLYLHVCPLCTPTPSPPPSPGRKREWMMEKPEQRSRANQLVSEEYQLFWKKLVTTSSNSV